MSDKSKNRLFQPFHEMFESLRQTIPSLGKKEALWDDGTDGEKIDLNDERGKFIYAIFIVYGVLGGIIACHYCKYLHQAINCQLWGIELTRRRVPTYSVIGFLSDMFAWAFVYAFAFLLGAVLWGIVKSAFSKTLENSEAYCSAGLMYGLLCMVVITAVTALIPFSIFLIGA